MKDKKKIEKNAFATFFRTFLQKILNSKLLYAVVDGKKIILVVARFKLESVII